MSTVSFEEPSATPARLTAPASGLFLEAVFYQEDERDCRWRPRSRAVAKFKGCKTGSSKPATNYWRVLNCQSECFELFCEPRPNGVQ